MGCRRLRWCGSDAGTWCATRSCRPLWPPTKRPRRTPRPMKRDTQLPTWGSWWDRLPPPIARAIAVAMAVWIAVGLIFAASLYTQRVRVAVGDTAPRSVYAPFNVVDWAATRAKQRQAASQVPVVYVTDPKVLGEVERQVRDDFLTISALSSDTVVPLSARAAEAAALMPIGVPSAVWAQVLQLSPGAQDVLETNVSGILNGLLSATNGGVRNTPDNLEAAKSYIATQAGLFESQPGLRLFVTNMATALLKPNSFPDMTLTNQRRAEAAASVPLVRVLKGTRVLTKGEV